MVVLMENMTPLQASPLNSRKTISKKDNMEQAIQKRKRLLPGQNYRNVLQKIHSCTRQALPGGQHLGLTHQPHTAACLRHSVLQSAAASAFSRYVQLDVPNTGIFINPSCDQADEDRSWESPTQFGTDDVKFPAGTILPRKPSTVRKSPGWL